MHFYWDQWNTQHIAQHGVGPDEAEDVVRGARPPFPRQMGHDKVLVRGPTRTGRQLQVIYVLRRVESLDIDQIPPEIRLLMGDVDTIIYVIHARPLTSVERRTVRKGRRKK
jgi:uncharacterized DUF497 family protein